MFFFMEMLLNSLTYCHTFSLKLPILPMNSLTYCHTFSLKLPILPFEPLTNQFIGILIPLGYVSIALKGIDTPIRDPPL